jgi:hypothetical protein
MLLFQKYYLKPVKVYRGKKTVRLATCLELAEEILTLMPQLMREQLIQKPVGREKFIDCEKNYSLGCQSVIILIG